MKAKRQARTFLQVIKPKDRVLRAFKLLENHGCCRRYQWSIFGINLSSNLQLMQIISPIKAKRQRIMWNLKAPQVLLFLGFHFQGMIEKWELNRRYTHTHTHTHFLLSLGIVVFLLFLFFFLLLSRFYFDVFRGYGGLSFCDQLKNLEGYLVWS